MARFRIRYFRIGLRNVSVKKNIFLVMSLLSSRSLHTIPHEEISTLKSLLSLALNILEHLKSKSKRKMN